MQEEINALPDGTVPGAEHLRRLALFADLPEEDLERLLAAGRTIRVDAGDSLMDEGTPGDGLYLVMSGSWEGRVAEYVDHLHEHFVDPCVVENGRYQPPSRPGFSIEMKADTLAQFPVIS